MRLWRVQSRGVPLNKFTAAYLAAAAVLAGTSAHADDLDQLAPRPDVAGTHAATAVADVVVTANRTVQELNRVAASITVLDQAAIERAQTPAIAELLTQTPGVAYSRNGGIGGVGSVYIRGAEGHHTVILVDGVKLNDPSTTQGGFNFGNLTVGDTARIEVLRGAQSTLWGSQAIGGVVNIITAAPSTPFEGNLLAEAGARGTTQFRAGVGGASDHLNWRLAASRYDTDGLSAQSIGTEKDGFTNNTVSGRVDLKITDAISLDLRSSWNDSTGDYDGWNGDSREYAETEELVAYGGLNISLMEGRFLNRLAYSYTETERQFYNPDNAIQTNTFDSIGKNKRFEYQGSFAFTDDLNATFGFESERAQMRSRSPSDFAPNPAYNLGRADQDSVYGQVQWTTLPGLTLTAGVRYDDHAQYGDHTTGQLAAAWVINDGATTLRAGWGQGFRAPGLYELYSDYGNLALQPETFDAWEAGIEHRFGNKAALGVTYFAREADNEIRYRGCSAGATDPLCLVNGNQRWGYYDNIQKTEAQGVEVFGRWSPITALTFSGNYSWTDARNASGVNDGKRLARRPEHMANLSADYHFSQGLNTGVSVRYAGKAFDSESNAVALDDYTLVDLRVSYAVRQGVELYGRIENLFDTDYETVRGFGTAGRGAFGGVRLRF